MSAWLAAAYAVLALGLGWVLTSATAWKQRIPFIVAAPALALGLWLGRPDPTGWPSAAHIPAHASLQWAVVDEPDPATSDPGRVYLWLDVGGAAPRAFSLPYSRSLHKQVQHALMSIQHGRPIAVARSHPAGRGGGRGTTPGHGGVVHFYRHPPVRLPPKPRT
jgi:hypothetical protein